MPASHQPNSLASSSVQSGGYQPAAYDVSAAVGVDIGGANLKLADSGGASVACSFRMWCQAEQLAQCLRTQFSILCQQTQRRYARVAVTLTGEMADCFPSRAAGVAAILEHVSAAFTDLPQSIYGVDGRWYTPLKACAQPWEVAASNWHGLASWIGQAMFSASDPVRLVLDVGSTTVDIIPLLHGAVATTAGCDSERLRMKQLVYTGVGRTPIAAILDRVNIEGQAWPLVAERFATSDDAYLALGLIGDDASVDGESTSQGSTLNHDTADGRPRSVYHAQARLARMLAEDLHRLSTAQVNSLARQIVDAQARRIAEAIQHNLSNAVPALGRLPWVIISGHGRCLADAALALVPTPVRPVYLEDHISPAAARCAPAVAVAWLLEQCR